MASLYTPTLRDMIINNAARYGDEDAYVCGDKRVTFAEYAAQSQQLASAITTLNIQPGDRVGILSMNSIEICVLYGACNLYGFIASTVNFRLAPPEMLYIINDASQKILFFEDTFTEHIDQIRSQLTTVEHFVAIGQAPEWALSLDELMARGDPAGPNLLPPAHDDIAFLMYTSGTTGKPKGVMLEHGAQVENGRQIASAFQSGPSDKILLMMPLFHIGAKAVEVSQHWQSGCVHIHRTFDAEAIFRTIEKERITLTHMAPTMIQELLDHPSRDKYDLSSLRRLLYSAAAMPTTVLRRAIEAFGPIFMQMYGQTEGCGAMLPADSHRPDGSEKDIQRLSSIGPAIPGCRFRIVDDNENEVPVGTPGELCFQGPVTMRGYWNNSAATIEALRDGWLHSGDIARCDEDGFIYLIDRKKDVIVSGGENVYSREVEEALLQHPEISEAAVFGIPHKKWGEAVCAAVVVKPGAMISENDVIAHSRTLIAGYKRPQTVHVVPALPKLVSGKIAKVELRALYAKPIN